MDVVFRRNKDPAGGKGGTTPPMDTRIPRPARAGSSRDRRRILLLDALHAAGLVVVIVLALFPIYWMVSASFKTDNQLFAVPPVWLWKPTLAHYGTVLHDTNMMGALANSLSIAGLTTLLSLLLGVPAGYGIARYQFRFRRDVWFWFVSNWMIIPVVLVIPYFLIATKLHLLGSRWLLVAIYQTFGVPLAVWLMVDQFRSIPAELEEVARIDGTSVFGAFIRIMVPLALPGVVVSGILVALFAWNELLYAQALIPSLASRTAPVVALTFLGGYEVPWGDVMAAGTLIVLPVLAFAALVSRYLVRGLTLGAIK